MARNKKPSKEQMAQYMHRLNMLNMRRGDFAAAIVQQLTSLTDTSVTTVSRYNKYTKDNLLTYLKNPISYEKQLRDASIYMYTASPQYWNLINYHALMPQWDYIIAPMKFDRQKVKSDAIYKQFIKANTILQNMNLKHELIKASRVAWREDVFYGVELETKDSYQIQRINPDLCKISSVEDGCFNFAVDFAQITEDSLFLYPEFFTQMWNAYQHDSTLQWQEIPSDVSVCFKVNEDLLYPYPPFASTLPLLYDIEDFRDLIKERTKIDIYKLVHCRIPVDAKNVPMDMDVCLQYYEQALSVAPTNVGMIVTPFEVSEIKFDKTGLTDTDEVAKAEEHFWSATGSSPLLFGGSSESVAALKLSIRNNEQLVLAFMKQVERWLNRKLKRISGTVKFKATILPVTYFNIEEKVAMYKEAATYGLPTKSMYAAAADVELNDIEALTYLENEVLQFPEEFIPLSSSYTQSGGGDSGGRPTNESKGEDLTPAGEQTRNDEENAKRGLSSGDA